MSDPVILKVYEQLDTYCKDVLEGMDEVQAGPKGLEAR